MKAVITALQIERKTLLGQLANIDKMLAQVSPNATKKPGAHKMSQATKDKIAAANRARFANARAAKAPATLESTAKGKTPPAMVAKAKNGAATVTATAK